MGYLLRHPWPTAYSLSRRFHCSSKCRFSTLTFVCPHNLTSRPLVSDLPRSGLKCRTSQGDGVAAFDGKT